MITQHREFYQPSTPPQPSRCFGAKVSSDGHSLDRVRLGRYGRD